MDKYEIIEGVTVDDVAWIAERIARGEDMSELAMDLGREAAEYANIEPSNTYVCIVGLNAGQSYDLCLRREKMATAAADRLRRVGLL